MVRRRLIRIAVVAGAAALALTAVIGFAHTGPGRPVLMMLGKVGFPVPAGSCPLGYDRKQSPELKQAERVAFARLHHGDAAALGRPALGFTLDVTTPEQVLAWANEHHVDCTQPTRGHDLECTAVPASALGDANDGVAAKALWMDFASNGRLSTVIAMRRSPTAPPISHAFSEVSLRLNREVGPSTAVQGDPALLSSGNLYQAVSEYKFADYYAVMRATNMGDGFLLSQEFRSLPDQLAHR